MKWYFVVKKKYEIYICIEPQLHPTEEIMVHTPTITSTYSPHACVTVTVLNLENEVDSLQVTSEASIQKVLGSNFSQNISYPD
jgi:hypothetical protein